MNNEGGRINFEAGMELSQFNRSKQEVLNSFEQIGQSAVENGKQIDDMFSGLERSVMRLAGAIGLGMGLKEFANQVIETRGQFQQLELAFETMLGSADKANVLFNDLVDLAAKTPFDLLGVANGAARLWIGSRERERNNASSWRHCRRLVAPFERYGLSFWHDHDARAIVHPRHLPVPGSWHTFG